MKGLENLKNHPGAKNLDGMSQRSKYSVTTSVRRRLNSVAHDNLGKDMPEPILEQDGENGGDGAIMYDKEGNPIELTREQIELIDQLNKQ